MPSVPSALPDHLGYWLRKLSNAVTDAFAARLSAHGVSVPQWVVLRVLFDGEAFTLKEIVARVEVDQGSLSRMVDRLIVRGWVRRESGGDRRSVAISLTQTGRGLVPVLAALADENDREFFSALGAADRKKFLAAIRRLLARSESDGRSPVG